MRRRRPARHVAQSTAHRRETHPNEKLLGAMSASKILLRRNLELIQMVTHSLYIAISTKTLDDAVLPELVQDFQKNHQELLA